MSERDPDLPTLRWELAGVAAGTTTLHQRAQVVLERLGQVLPFDAAWLAVRDPERRRHTPLATTGPAEPLHRYFRTPEADAEVDQLGLNRRRAPTLVGDIPVALPEFRAWAEHLLPDPRRPDGIDRRIVAGELDRTPEIAETARIVEAATEGVVLTRGGDILTLPGLPDHRLLSRGSAVLTTAVRELTGRAHISFLAPLPGRDGQPLVRVTAFDCAAPHLDSLSTAVLLSPPGDLRGLSTRELLVLGLLVDGTTSVPAITAALGVDTAEADDALRAALGTLSAPDRPAAAVRALRAGLRIPPQLAADWPPATT